MAGLKEAEKRARDRLCLALDVDSPDKAINLVRELSDYVGVFKVGKELHTAAGNYGVNIVSDIHLAGGQVFLDLKFHDTPKTVYKASVEASRADVYMFNLHVAGGKAMCKAALEGVEKGHENSAEDSLPRVIGVTVLTSLDDKDLRVQGLGISYNDLVRRRTELARRWGLDGVVCPANKAGELEKEFGSDFMYVTPGIKWAGIKGLGQKQLYTPDKAVKDCSNSLLVIGSAIINSRNMKKTSYEILKAMSPYV